MRVPFLAILLAFGVSLHSDEIILDVGSVHTKNRTAAGKEYNNANFGIGFAKSVNEYVNLGVGAYENSFDKTSFWIGAEVLYPITSWLKAGGGIGVITGYKYDILPIPSLIVKSNVLEKVELAVLYTDSHLVHKDGVGVFHFQLRVPFSF